MNMLSCSISGRNYAQRAYDAFAEEHRGQYMTINFSVIPNFSPENIGEHETFYVDNMQFDMDVIHVERVELTDRTVYVLVGEPGRRSVIISVENGIASGTVHWRF